MSYHAVNVFRGQRRWGGGTDTQSIEQHATLLWASCYHGYGSAGTTDSRERDTGQTGADHLDQVFNKTKYETGACGMKSVL